MSILHMNTQTHPSDLISQLCAARPLQHAHLPLILLLSAVRLTVLVYQDRLLEPEFATGIFNCVAEPDMQQVVVAAFQS